MRRKLVSLSFFVVAFTVPTWTIATTGNDWAAALIMVILIIAGVDIGSRE
jgi:uncharacterized membrane protein YfcA